MALLSVSLLFTQVSQSIITMYKLELIWHQMSKYNQPMKIYQTKSPMLTPPGSMQVNNYHSQKSQYEQKNKKLENLKTVIITIK